MAGSKKLDYAKVGAASFGNDALRKGYDVGLIRFGSCAQCIVNAQKSLNVLQMELNKLTSDGSTDMAGAITTAHEASACMEASGS